MNIMIALPPHKILKEFGATAIVELKEDAYGVLPHDQKQYYLPKGTQGWVETVWGKVKTEFFNPSTVTGTYRGNSTVYFYWLSDGASNVIPVHYKDLKIIKKLTNWK